MPRIHITGASGTGTTTLGRALAGRLRVPHFESDSYYWIPTVPPFQIRRESAQRDARLAEDLDAFPDWVWSGSALSWTDLVAAPLARTVAPALTLCVFLTVPPELRLARLREREQAAFDLPGVPPEEREAEMASFLAWAAAYEQGGVSGRTLVRHEEWLASLTVPVLRIDGDSTTEQRLELVLDALVRIG